MLDTANGKMGRTKRLKELTIKDSFMFGAVMMEERFMIFEEQRNSNILQFED